MAMGRKGRNIDAIDNDDCDDHDCDEDDYEDDYDDDGSYHPSNIRSDPY